MLRLYKKLIILISLLLPLSVIYANTSTEMNCVKLQKILNHFRDKHKVTGAGLYVQWGGSNSSSCYLFSGTVEKGKNKAISQQNLWQIGSITKSYFAALLLQLEAKSEAGTIPIKFNIDQKVGRWLPQYSAWSKVTIKQLLNMTSGIYNYTALPHINKLILADPKKVWASNNVVDLAYQHKPNVYFSPGMGWHYSDTNYVMVGLIIQEIYKKLGYKLSLQEILDRNILDRIGLTSTYYATAGLNEKLLSRMVHGYNYYSEKDYTAINLSIAGAAGGGISTPEETARWVLDLFNGKVLPAKQLQEMKSLVSTKTGKPIQPNKTIKSPGYGLSLMEQYNKQFGEVWLYQGLTAGYTALYYYIPKYQAVISLAVSTGDIQKPPICYSNTIQKILKWISIDDKTLKGTEKT